MAASVVFALLSVLCVRSATAQCPDGTIKGLDRRTCYKVYPKALSWIDAEFRCQAEKGHLASSASATNNSFLQKATGKVALSNYWIGGAKDMQDGAWYWSDGHSWNYTSWATGKMYRRLRYWGIRTEYDGQKLRHVSGPIWGCQTLDLVHHRGNFMDGRRGISWKFYRGN